MSQVLMQRLNGIPVHRFQFKAVSPEGEEENFSYSASWERSAKLWSKHKSGYTVTATNWDRDTDTWVDATEAALQEGFRRADRAKKSKSDMPANVINVQPGLPANSADYLKGHADYVKTLSSVGRKQGLDADTRREFGMQTMQALTHAGFNEKEIKDLCQAYLRSLKASEDPQQ